MSQSLAMNLFQVILYPLGCQVKPCSILDFGKISSICQMRRVCRQSLKPDNERGALYMIIKSFFDTSRRFWYLREHGAAFTD